MNMGIGISTPGLSINFRTVNSFRNRDMQGIFLWSKETGKSECLWDWKGIKKALNAWEDSTEGKNFQPKINLRKALESGAPMSIFHLDGPNFLFVAGNVAFYVDIQGKTLRPAFAAKDVMFSSAWQDTDGTVFIPDEWRIAMFPPKGEMKTLALEAPVGQAPWIWAQPKNPAMSRNEMNYRPMLGTTGGNFFLVGGHTGLVTEKDVVRAIPLREGRKPWTMTEIRDEHKNLVPGVDGESFFLIQRPSWIKGDVFLARRDSTGKELWKTNLGDCDPIIHAVESMGKLALLVARDTKLLARIQLDPTSGKIIEEKVWDVAKLASEGQLPLSFGLLRRATVIPTRRGQLIWIPANGPVATPAENKGWASKMPTPADGGWFALDADLLLKPVAIHPLADQAVVLSQGRTVPVPSWYNSGIFPEYEIKELTWSKGEKDLPYYKETRGAAHTPLLMTDLKICTSPALVSWAEQLLGVN